MSKVQTFNEYLSEGKLNEASGKQIKDDYVYTDRGLQIILKDYFKFNEDDKIASKLAQYIKSNIGLDDLEKIIPNQEITYITVGIGPK